MVGHYLKKGWGALLTVLVQAIPNPPSDGVRILVLACRCEGIEG
jgi:hypothetical protein